MTAAKNLINKTSLMLLGAVAALASLTALASATSLCCYWYHQPIMPDSVRMMNK